MSMDLLTKFIRPFVNYSEFEKGWLAAAIDGEGTIYLRNGIEKHGWRMRQMGIVVTNTNYEFVRFAAMLLGARIGHSFKDEGPVYNTRLCDHVRVLGVLKQLEPYLIVKRTIARDLIVFIETSDWSRKRQFSEARSKYMKAIWGDPNSKIRQRWPKRKEVVV